MSCKDFHRLSPVIISRHYLPRRPSFAMASVSLPLCLRVIFPLEVQAVFLAYSSGPSINAACPEVGLDRCCPLLLQPLPHFAFFIGSVMIGNERVVLFSCLSPPTRSKDLVFFAISSWVPRTVIVLAWCLIDTCRMNACTAEVISG